MIVSRGTEAFDLISQGKNRCIRERFAIPDPQCSQLRGCLLIDKDACDDQWTKVVSLYVNIFVSPLDQGLSRETCSICTAGERPVSPHGLTDRERSFFLWQLSWANR